MFLAISDTDQCMDGIPKESAKIHGIFRETCKKTSNAFTYHSKSHQLSDRKSLPPRSNPTLATVAIQNYPGAFRFAGDVLRGDPAVAGLAARLDPLNLEFVAENLKVGHGGGFLRGNCPGFFPGKLG